MWKMRGPCTEPWGTPWLAEAGWECSLPETGLRPVGRGGGWSQELLMDGSYLLENFQELN